MSGSPQWNVKGVDEAARMVARDAAARAGMPIGLWIDRAIKRAAREEAIGATQPPDGATASFRLPVAKSSSSIERTVERGAVESPSAPPPIGTAAVRTAEPLLPFSRSSASSRLLRMAIAIGFLALLTGGGVWLLNISARVPTETETAALPESNPTQVATVVPPAAPPAEPAAGVPSAADAGAGSRPEAPSDGDRDRPAADTVAQIQRLLEQLDFDPGPADGVMSQKTFDAISTFQAMAGMPADGKASPALLDELREVAGAAKR